MDADEARRIHATYVSDMTLNDRAEGGARVEWITATRKPRSAFARRLAEKEFLTTMDYVTPIPEEEGAAAARAEFIRIYNAQLPAKKRAALRLLQDYCGMENVEAIDKELQDMQLMASGHAGVEAMRADHEAMDIIPPPRFDGNKPLDQAKRKNFLAGINNATYSGGQDNIHEGNLLTMILSGLKMTIEAEKLTEEAGSQLTMACFRGKALDIFMIHRKQPKGFVTFWTLVQALSKTQISPTEAILRISKLKQQRIPSQGIASVITEIIRLNYFTLSSNQPKDERAEQFKTSTLRDLRDLVQCLYPSFTNQVTLKEREAKAAIEAQKANFRALGEIRSADALEIDPVSCLVQAMISILHVESEGSRIEFESLDSAMGSLRRPQERQDRHDRHERRSNRRQPRVNAITFEAGQVRRPQMVQRPINNSNNYQGGARPKRQLQERTWPQCNRCGKHHEDQCRRYKRSSKFPCPKCKQEKNLSLFHLNEDCSRDKSYALFAEPPRQRQVASMTPQRKGSNFQPRQQGWNSNQNQGQSNSRQRDNRRQENNNSQRGHSAQANNDSRNGNGRQQSRQVAQVDARPRSNGGNRRRQTK